jgi:penicillin-binding protein 2
MLDCRTGDILCLVSNPSFDANQFVKGVPPAEYQALASYDHKPLFNKALTANYAPGSTFKTMVALAALEMGYDPKTVHVCNKAWTLGNHTFHCDHVHGAQDMRGAIKVSCDVYFFQTAMTVGPDRIAAMARQFGLGSVFDIGIPGQKPGIVPDTAWKAAHVPRDPKWHPGDTPSIGIGQGYVSINALQSATMCARIANGGKAIQPRLIHSVGPEVTPEAAPTALAVAPEHVAFVQSAMTGVVNEPGGTAFAEKSCVLNLGPVVMAGKSGTAQAHTYAAGSHGAHGAKGEWALRDHAWFIAYAPADDPRYAISVLVEHGGFGASTSAPLAREIMKVALLKDPEVRKRFEQPPGEAPPTPAAATPAEGSAPDASPTDPDVNTAATT